MNIFIQIITLANIFATVHVSTKHEKDGEKKTQQRHEQLLIQFRKCLVNFSRPKRAVF